MATPTNNTVDQTYFKQPTESIDQYNARISQYNSSKSTPAQSAMTGAITGQAPMLPGLGGATISRTSTSPLSQGSLSISNAPVQQTAGSYQGQSVYSGSDAQVQAQMAAIDAKKSQASNTQVLGAQQPPTQQMPVQSPPQQTPAQQPPQQTPPTQQQPPQQTQGLVSLPYQPNNQLSGQITSNLANTAQQGSPNATAAQQNLQGLATQPSVAVQQAQDQLKQFQTQYAQQRGLIGLEPIPLQFQQGRQQVIANQYAQELPAYQTAVQNALLGQGQQITAGTSAAGAANTQQANLQSGLNQAGQLAAPIQAPYGAQVLSPATGQSIQGASPFGTGPTAAANVASVVEQQKIVNDWSATRNSAANIGNQLTQFLSANNVNPAEFNKVNQFLQFIAGNTSSPQYKQFYNLVTDLANTYAPILSTTGDASNYKTQLAQSLLDGTANGQTFPQILSSLDSQAQAKIAGYQQNIQAIQSGQNVNPAPAARAEAKVTGFSW